MELITLAFLIIVLLGILIGVLWWELQELREKYRKAVREYAEEVAKWRQ